MTVHNMHESEPFTHFGELLISGGLAVIGWVMAKFTSHHIESMDRLTEKIGFISQDVSSMKTDISAIRAGQDKLEIRVSRLESHHLDEAP